jgi:hypothetical protein
VFKTIDNYKRLGLGFSTLPTWLNPRNAKNGIMPLPLKLQRCVVFFGVAPNRSEPLPQDNSKFGGTGFVVSLPFSRGRFAHNYLVTNVHVATNLQSQPGSFVRLNLAAGGSEAVWLDGQRWTHHPRPEVDIAILRPDFNRFPSWADLALDALSFEDFVPEELLDGIELGVGDPIHVSGLLSKTPGASRNMPLVRSGTLGALASEPVQVRTGVFEPVHLGIIQSIGGMSGSPTFIEYRTPRYATTPDPGKPWGYLLGVNAGHFTDLVDGTADERAHAGVNVIYPARLLKEILALPDVEQERASFESALRTVEPESFPG